MSSETFDAFYARTAWNVTSQMHSMVGLDSDPDRRDPDQPQADSNHADHAVREAYARAYQQWYEVSGYRDPEAWVLKVAEECFERRRAQAAAAELDLDASENADPKTWPGIYRPRSARKQGAVSRDPSGAAPGQAAGDGAPGAAMASGAVPGAPPAGGGRNGRGVASAGIDSGRGSGEAGRPRHGAGGDELTDSTWLGDPRAAGGAATHGATPGSAAPTTIGGRSMLRLPAALADRRMLLAGIAAVVVVAVGAYLAFGGQQPVTSADRGSSTGANGKPTVHMLRAGQTAGRAAVPWSIVTTGWTLAELSAAQPGLKGIGSGPGQVSLYLVDPAGGKYLMHTWTGASVTLLAWSGDAARALLRVVSHMPGPQSADYNVLTLATGHLTSLGLRADVTPVGFTRPKGLNVLAVRRAGGKFQLRRYDLSGAYQATLSTMPDRQPSAASPSQPPACPSSLCNALSAPDGYTAIWGIAGNEMQLVRNGGGLILRLHVPGSGTPPSCIPISWWNADTVLANCAAPGQLSANSERLWLVPTNGTSATAVAPPSGSPSTAGFDAAAWIARGHVYVTQTKTAQCSTGAGVPGLGIRVVGQGGSLTTVSVPGSTHNYDNVVGAVGSRLLVLAQTSCLGTSSLLWFSPSAGTATTLLPGTAGQLGVVAAVPYQGASTAYSLGWRPASS